MTDLIARLEAAGEGSRELDKKIAWAANPSRDPLAILGIPHYTTSLDAALTLVPEGWCWSLSTWGRTGGFAALAPKGWREYETAEDAGGVEANGNTPALALCIAALKAREKANG